MQSTRKKLERKLGLWAFLLGERIFAKKSPAAAERTGERLGMLFFRTFKKRRTRALANLALAFPELSEAEREELAKGTFLHFGRITADFLRSGKRTNSEVLRTCTLTGLEHVEAALAAGKGTIIITGHFGNWERGAQCLVAKGYKLTVVARDANDEGLNQRVLEMRKANGLEVLSRGNAARGILSKLKKNELVAILPDQNSGDIFVPFFGVPCGTVTGPSTIWERTGCAVVPVFCSRVGVEQYAFRAYPALQPVEGFEPVEGMTRAINLCLEGVIREHPEQWLWFHDRWKSARKQGLT